MLGMSVGSGSGVVGTTGKGESWLLEGIKVIGQCRFYSQSPSKQPRIMPNTS